MGYNFLSEAAYVNTSQLCKFDSTIGYEADFSENGNMDGWVYNDDIHTYGCWNNFIFATLYDSQPIIGREDVFAALNAEDYYNLQIAMKYSAVDREGAHALPTTGKVRWRTLTDPVWNSSKEKEFTIYPDGVWHSYVLNMAEAQWWQGDIFDLRIYPTIDGMADDEFFIRSIRISSVDTYQCRNIGCETYLRGEYVHNCPGVGLRGYCKSSNINSDYYSFEAEVDDSLIVNINDYGDEVIRLGNINYSTGLELTRIITEGISRTDIGGYSEVQVEYTDFGEFIIHSGTYADDSSVVVKYSPAAVILGFYDEDGGSLYSSGVGKTPADLFEPFSSFKVKKFQLFDLFDSDIDSSFTFNPFAYNITGGRLDWFKSGTGTVNTTESDVVGGITEREFQTINNYGKTIIDFTHPFNASGRIKKIYIACTLDIDGTANRSRNDASREEMSNAKIIILRPKRDGRLEVVTKIDINDRDRSSGQLYSISQECVDIDCDIWVNKGDLIGLYNAEIYVGATIAGEIDALYYQISGDPVGVFDPGNLSGDGGAGLLMFARSDEFQRKLVIDIDLGNRVNVSQVKVAGVVDIPDLEFNIARCVDINWDIKLFGEEHKSSYRSFASPGIFHVTYPNYAFGEENLTDGVTVVPDGLAADSFSLSTYGVTPANPKYFFVNGDQEWLGIHILQSVLYYDQATYGFTEDPIAFDLEFPYRKSKTIYKSRIYFKEKNNFRSFELSTYLGAGNSTGNSNFDADYQKIPGYTSVTLDGVKHDEESPQYNSLDLYLFQNPSVGHADMIWTSGPGVYGDGGSFDGIAYSRGGSIVNNDTFNQALLTDWVTLEHEWEPISCKGFRFYTYHHKSTKICEFEVYAVVEEVTTSMVGGINIVYSDEGNRWYSAETTQEGDSDNILASIGGMPRYYNIEIEPITETILSSIEFSPKIEDMFLGDKGCEYNLLLDDCKKGTLGKSQRIDIKNVYGDEYDLYVDISGDEQSTNGLALFTEMNNTNSITDPFIGPDGFYQKEDDYELRNDNNNVAINCECYGLKNLIDSKQSYYTYDNMYKWDSFGTLTHGEDIDFSNAPQAVFTILGLPNISRNRYWKIGFRSEDNSMKLRELRVYYEDVEVDCNFYHETTLDYTEGPISDTAPHVYNSSVVGSYYTIDQTKHLGIDLGSQKSIDRLVLYHDVLNDVSPANAIDTRTLFYLKGNNYVDLYATEDYSYYEHDITIHGAGLATTKVFNPESITKSFSEDFSTSSGISSALPLSNESCIISGSHYDIGYEPSKAFDKDNGTSWSTSSGVPCYIDCDFITPVSLRSYAIRAYGDTAPKSWELQGFNGSDWDILDSVSNYTSWNSSYAITKVWDCYNKNYPTLDGNNSSATEELVGHESIYLFDGDSTTYWAATSYNNPTIKYDYGIGNEIVIDSYALLAGISYYAWMPKAWRFQASNDDSSWVTLDEVDDASSWSSNEFRSYNCDNEIAYRYYRLNIVGGNDSVNIRMYGFELGKLYDVGYNKYRLYVSSVQDGDTTTINEVKFYSAVSLTDYINNDGYWIEDTTYESYFNHVPASGTVTSGIYEFPGRLDFEVSTSNYSNDGFFRKVNFEKPDILGEFSKFWEFDLKFKINISSIQIGGTTESYFSVGVFIPLHGLHSWVRQWWAEFFKGIQLSFGSGNFALALQQGGDTYASDGGYDTDIVSGFQFNTTYYCQLTSNGEDCDTIECGELINTVYTAKVWTDDWDGSALVADLSLEDTLPSNIDYYTSYVGFGSGAWGGYHPPYPYELYTGWISDIQFSATRYLPTLLYSCGSLKFNGTSGSYLEVNHDNGPCSNIEQSSFENIEDTTEYKITGWIKFNSLPTDYDEEWTICEHTDYHHGNGGSDYDVFSVYFKKNSLGTYQFCLDSDCVDWTPTLYEWYQFYASRDGRLIEYGIYGEVSDSRWANYSLNNVSQQQMIIGKNFDGLIREICISSDSINGDDYNYRQVKQWERFYAMSIYVSNDNINYGHYCDVDPHYSACTNSTYSYDFTRYNNEYYSYLAIDLEKRYNIDLIRSYGSSSAHLLSMFDNVVYSSSDVSNVEDVVWGDDFDFSSGGFCTGGTANASYTWSSYPPSYAFDGNTNSAWRLSFVDSTYIPEGGSWLGYDFGEGNEKIVNLIYLKHLYDNDIEVEGTNDIAASWSDKTWIHIASIINGLKKSESISKHYFKNTTAYRYMRIRLPEEQLFSHVYVLEMYGEDSLPSENFTDARWIGLKLLNGDGTSRTTEKLGVYPNIQENVLPSGGDYNVEWDSLGKYITQYSEGTNLALGATVSGSSFFGNMHYESITDGIITYGLDSAWGSDKESTQWLSIDLGSVYDIYRIKLFHGVLEEDSRYLIEDYSIQTSTDGSNYTTHFTITNNDEFERTHDIPDSVSARFVRININDFSSWGIYAPDGVGTSYFRGAVLREVQVFEYYGYIVANSEDYPIIAVDLNQQFYITGNEVVGLKVEDTTIDWSSANSYFAYSDSVFDDPKKISFDVWGKNPNYVKWLAIRRDTATDHLSGPDYMKHVITKRSGKPNPCEYYWWWESTYSTLSNVYDYVFGDQAVRALKISYPASTETDIVYFSEGDDFGIDTDASWRDGIYFKLYIDDINNLDVDFGNFSFGGYDSTSSENPVIYTWDFSSLSLVTGWNTLFLKFKYASWVYYYLDANSEVLDNKVIYKLKLQTLSMTFRGVGNPLVMYIDGFKIKRLHFEEKVFDDNYGLYLKGNDFYSCPIGDFDLTKGTIEFWFRPDYGFTGVDGYGEFSNRSLFHFTNSNNDVLGAFISRNGIEIYYGNLYNLYGYSTSIINDFGFDSTYHFALVYSSNGSIYDGSSIQLYLNGVLASRSFSTWKISEYKLFKFILGGKGLAATKSTAGYKVTSFDAVVYGLKIYNYCKTDFSNIKDMSNYIDPNLTKPSELIEISKDNLTFYKVGDPNLPFKFDMVPSDSSVPVYVRTDIPLNLKLDNKRTTGLNIQWDISV
jgi:hypothetical protein